jgi:hypothetical protein
MVVLAGVFVGTTLVFFVYVTYVQRRQKAIMDTAIRTTAVVSAMFPSNVRDRILSDAGARMDNMDNAPSAKQRLKRFLNGDIDHDDVIKDNPKKSKPIGKLSRDCVFHF